MAKSTTPKGPSITLTGGMPEMHLDMPLDQDKVAQIQKCLASGRLKISLSQVDLARGRLGSSYLYD